MARTPKRRRRSPHPGVVLLPPEPGRRAWRARFVDPDTERMVKVRLDPAALSTAETRRDWAIRKAKAIARRRMELEGGAARETGTPLDDAVERYFQAHPRLRDKTLRGYRDAADRLLDWAKRTRVRSADDLTRAKLLAFREERIRAPRMTQEAGGKRGAHKPTNDPRSAHTINRELRSVLTILGYLRKLDLLPRLSADDLRDGLERISTSSERIHYLRSAELRRLLKACLRHDGATFEATRDEHRGDKPEGSTLRYERVTPFVATVLLTGMRLGEALSLDWKQVDLDALDHEGRKVGEIYLSTATKTKRARTIDLEVSPALRRILAAQRLATGGKGPVFPGMTEGVANAARKRLLAEYGAPEGFGWQALRRTTGTYLTNAPGIFGAASAYRSARQLGHSVAVAEKHYLGLARGIPRDARSLEEAMQIEEVLELVIAAMRAPRAAPRRRSRGGVSPA